MAVPAASTAELQAALDAAFDLIDGCLASPTGSAADAFWADEFFARDCSEDGTTSSYSSSLPLTPLSPSPPPPAPCEPHPRDRAEERPRVPEREASSPVCRTESTNAHEQKKKKTLTHQERQKQEIAQLRHETSQLATHLELLQLLSGSAKAANTTHCQDDFGGLVAAAVARNGTSCVDPSSHSDLTALWKDMAARHKTLRGAAEVVNAKLRLRVAEQRKVIRSIQKLLRRLAARQKTPTTRPMDVVRADISMSSDDLMGTLSREIVVIYQNVDLALQLCGLGTGRAVPIQERLAQLSPTSFATQVVESRLMPFDFRDVAEILWRTSTNLSTHSDYFQKQATIKRDGTIFRSYEMEPSTPSHEFAVKGDHAVRMFAESERCVLVNCGVARPTMMRGADISGLTCRETGRVVISNVPRTSGSNRALCRLDICFGIVVETNGTAPSGKALAVDICKLLTAHKVQSFDLFQGNLEATLLLKQSPQQLVRVAG